MTMTRFLLPANATPGVYVHADRTDVFENDPVGFTVAMFDGEKTEPMPEMERALMANRKSWLLVAKGLVAVGNLPLFTRIGFDMNTTDWTEAAR